MKKIVLIGILIISISKSFAQCDDMIYEIDECISNAEDSYKYLHKAFKEVDYVEYSDSFNELKEALETAQTYCKKGKSYAEDAESDASDAYTYASDCGCSDGESYSSDAESNAYDAYTYAKKAYHYIGDALYSDNLDDMKYYVDDILKYLKKAYNAIDDAKSEAESARYECE